MKVLLLNGSTRLNGCTYTALCEVERILKEEGIETEIFQLGGTSVRDCIACGYCYSHHQCVFDDDAVNEWTKKAKEADGFIIGTPVYYAHPSGQVISFLDRAFYSSKASFTHKPAAAIASARRAGTTASLDVIHKHFMINQMPVVSSSYWNMVHGNTPKEVMQDEEGLQTMRNLARNMAWLLKCIKAGEKEGISVPENEKGKRTNFIR